MTDAAVTAPLDDAGQAGRTPAASEEIVVLDYGGQYSQLIARRVRDCGVFSELLPHDTPVAELTRRRPRGIILSGGPASVYAEGAPRLDHGLLELGVPVMGICYGMQLLVQELGGRVEQAEVGEFGRSDLFVANAGTLLQGTPPEQTCWMSHRDTVFEPPPGFIALASSSASPVAAVENPEAGIYGIQFHPEVVHTPYGHEILTHFLTDVCGCELTWSAASIVEDQIRLIRGQVGDANVICGLSGGVDSSVAALLVHRAIGDQLTCVFVDTGLLRAGEAEQVVETFTRHLHIPLVAVDARQRFLAHLQDVIDPEQKRKSIGEEFIRVFEQEAARLEEKGGPIPFLAQGTLYPDVIESTSHDTASTAVRIKTHHNVGGLPEEMKLKLVEPLRVLFKDEVREIGQALDLPEEWVWRHPFPGPGLAIRIIGEVTPERLETLRHADAIVIEELRAAGLYRQIGQAFAVLTPLQSVGVMGDFRTYASMVAIRAVTTSDFMTADWARLPHDVLARIAN